MSTLWDKQGQLRRPICAVTTHLHTACMLAAASADKLVFSWSRYLAHLVFLPQEWVQKCFAQHPSCFKFLWFNFQKKDDKEEKEGKSGSRRQLEGGLWWQCPRREIRIKEIKMVWRGNDPGEVMQSIPRNWREMIGADFIEHDGAGVWGGDGQVWFPGGEHRRLEWGRLPEGAGWTM